MVTLPIILLLLPSIFYTKKDYLINDAIYILGFIYLIGIAFNLIINKRNISLNLLIIYLISIIVFTDTFAYLIGSLIEKNKMALEISSKKSLEGFVAGLIGGSIVSLILYKNLIGNIDIKIVILSISLKIVGQLGDLVFSKIKRENNIKDFSNIISSHDGILDRLDSLIFVVLSLLFLLHYFLKRRNFMGLITLLVFVLMLGIIAFVYELGHFLWDIYEFSIWIGSIIYTHKGKDGIYYYKRALPIGGFVSMADEVYEDDDFLPKEWSLCNKPIWQRLIVMNAGVMNNFLLAIITFFAMALIWGSYSLAPKIDELKEGYPLA